jgi:hypothetical protein
VNGVFGGALVPVPVPAGSWCATKTAGWSERSGVSGDTSGQRRAGGLAGIDAAGFSTETG